MPTGAAPTSPSPAVLDNIASENLLGDMGIQPNQLSETPQSSNQLELLFSPQTSIIGLRSTIDGDHDADSPVLQNVEDEDGHTLTAYGDISLGENMVPSLPSPMRPSSSPLQPKNPRLRLYLKVRRPPMPKRRMSYIAIPDPMPHTRGSGLDELWPGSPRLIVNNPSWLEHQPMVSPLSVESPTSARIQGEKSVKNSNSSLENFVDELLPRSPSIRLSPPGSPASQAFNLPQESHEQGGEIREGQALQTSDGAAKRPQPSPGPAPGQDKPKSPAWRTRLPPRLPIPKWDM